MLLQVVSYINTGAVGAEYDKHKKQKANNVAQKVELAEQMKRMSDALGSKIKAAYLCKEFEVLLDKKEKEELEEYAAEQEQEQSDS